MDGNYTRTRTDSVLKSSFWYTCADKNILQEAEENISKDLWMRMLEQVRREYRNSSRFILMRILCARAESYLDPQEPTRGFTVQLGSKTLWFTDITEEHAEHLTADELDRYEQLLLALMREKLQGKENADTEILHKALYPMESQMLTRQEALYLGHALGLSAAEMKAVLMRIFDVEDGLRFNHSADLVEAYAFLNELTPQQTEALHEKWRRMGGEVMHPAGTTTASAGNMTLTAEDALDAQNALWPQDPTQREAAFLSWLKNAAPALDHYSVTATLLYQRLAAYAAEISKRREEGESQLYEAGGSFLEGLDLVVEHPGVNEMARNWLYNADQTLSEKKCQKVAKQILCDNRDAAGMDYKAREDSWQWITTDAWGHLRREKGLVSRKNEEDYRFTNGKAPETRHTNRVQQLLLGNQEVEKNDVLYLVWYIVNCYWYNEHVIDPDENLADESTCCEMLYDLIDLSNSCLQQAGLPEFYLPHLMEQSMLLSILAFMTRETEYASPAETYGNLCGMLVKHRQSKKKKLAE